MIFTISDRCISSATLSMSAGISHTGVALEPSILKITCNINNKFAHNKD